ncbi:MAG: RNA-directed DNA polymerase [Kiritimatiellia bacterium]
MTNDKRVKHLLVRLLRSGILEDGLCRPNSEGAPQGSVISPLLSNIYLHYVLDLWFEKRVRMSLRGGGYLFRYADDFVVCLQYRGDGNRLMRELEERLEAFSLEVATDKTAMVPFGRFEENDARKAGRKPGSFVFLGFRFVCGKSQSGFSKVKRICFSHVVYCSGH